MKIYGILGGYLFIGGLLAATYFILLSLLFDPQGDAFQRGTWGVSTCCIAACLFMGM